MIDALWRFPAALLALWALLAALWLWARPQQGRRLLDWAYPLLPLLVAMLPGLWPSQTWLPLWLQAGLWLWVWLTVVWVISLLKKDSSIMDMAFGLLDERLVGGIQEGGQAAVFAHIGTGLRQGVLRVGAGNHEADRAKALLRIQLALCGVDLQHQRRAGARIRPGGVRVCPWCQQHLAALTPLFVQFLDQRLRLG